MWTSPVLHTTYLRNVQAVPKTPSQFPVLTVGRQIQLQGEKWTLLKRLPPRSLDMTPSGLFLWGYIKDNAYVPLSPFNFTGSEYFEAANHGLRRSAERDERGWGGGERGWGGPFILSLCKVCLKLRISLQNNTDFIRVNELVFTQWPPERVKKHHLQSFISPLSVVNLVTRQKK